MSNRETVNGRKILYITYDGLTDPLGQSQILPYLTGLSELGYRFAILSFEKKDRYAKNRKIIEEICSKANIKWVPLSFTTQPPLLSKFYDTMRMRGKAFSLYRREKFDMVHCRSYIAADIGLRMKRKFGTRFFFDMRGFWADEKRDGGAWKEDHPVFKRVYSYYKKKEAQYVSEADHIISLTEAGRDEMKTWSSFSSSVPLSVIPCCADMKHFSLKTKDDKTNARKRLAIDEGRLVISYLGSVGAWYMLDEMLDFFSVVLKSYPDALFLFISHSDPSFIRQQASKHDIDGSALMITEASRNEVPLFMKASDISLFFIKPVYSKISSSPTKLGEVLSMGIPVIANSGVGDVESIINSTESGIVIKEFNEQAYADAVAQIPSILDSNPSAIREKATKFFDLQKGVSLYSESYQQVFSRAEAS